MARFNSSFLGRDMAVDLGTANTLVYVRGEGIVLCEPSVVAVRVQDGRAVAVGTEAKRMIGKTPAHIQAIRPLKDGVISDFEVCETMLRYFIQRVHNSRFSKPRMIICVPSGVTGVEQRAVQDAAEFAGARKPAHIIEEPMAAAIGAGLPVQEPTGNMIVDIGGGTTEVAMISLGGVVTSQSVRVGGDELDEAIIQYIKKEYSLALGERTAEVVKMELGSAWPLDQELQAEIRGRDLVTGLPKTIVTSTYEIREAIEEPVVGHRRRGEGHPRQDAARAGGRHHGTGHRARRRRRAAQGSAQATRPGDGHAHPHRPPSPRSGRARFRAGARGVRGARARWPVLLPPRLSAVRTVATSPAVSRFVLLVLSLVAVTLITLDATGRAGVRRASATSLRRVRPGRRRVRLGHHAVPQRLGRHHRLRRPRGREQQLRQQLDDSSPRRSTGRTQRSSSSELNEQLQLGFGQEIPSQIARVTSGPYSNFTGLRLELDKGSDSGLAVGMPGGHQGRAWSVGSTG